MTMNNMNLFLNLDQDNAFQWTIRSTETGGIICTGYSAYTASEAEEMFLREEYHSDYSPSDIYASEAQWND